MTDAQKALEDIFKTICPTTTWPSGVENHQGRITLEQFNTIRAALQHAGKVGGLAELVIALEFYANESTYKLKQHPAGPMGASGIEWRDIEHDQGRHAMQSLATFRAQEGK